MDATVAIQIGMAVGLLVSFFASFLSAKTWKIGQVILVFFIFLAAAAFWYLAAAALKIQASYGTLANKYEAAVEHELKAVQVLKEGRAAAEKDEALLAELEKENAAYLAGLQQLEAELHNATFGRGRVWTNIPASPPAADGSIGLTIEKPTPHAIHSKSVVYLFEDGLAAEGAAYLGEFIVTAVGEGTATLTPAAVMSAAARDRLSNSTRSWSIYELAPADKQDIFAGIDENQLRAMLPEATLQEYLKDGKPAAEDDPADRVTERKVDGEVQRFYQRRLRDYPAHFHEIQLQFFVLQNLIEQKEKDNALLEQTVVKTEADAKIYESEKGSLTSDLEHFQKELELIKKQVERLAAVEKRLSASAAGLLTQIQQQGTELARLQLEAARNIENKPPATDTATGTDSAAPTADTALVGP